MDWCLNNPNDDHIFTFENTSIKCGSGINCINMFNIDDIYVAGSYALRHMLDFLHRNYSLFYSEAADGIIMPSVSPFNFRWKSNDIDLFLLNRELLAHNKMGTRFDIILSPEKSIQALLLGFDLPVCRVGFNLAGHSMYPSKQCFLF